MLKAQNITAGYGSKVILPKLSMMAAPGTVTVLIGPNGSGKSTLLRCLAGVLRPFSGSVTLAGENLYRLSARDAARQIAYVPQETAMPFSFTVRELVGLAKGEGDGAGETAVKEAMDLLDIGKLADRALDSLSGGEKQRAAIARGLAQQTPYLLLDEPTAHLDLRHQTALFRELRRSSRESEIGVIIVLHDLSLAAQCADEVVLLNHGVIEGSGDVADVITETLLEKVYGVSVRIIRQNARVVAVAPADDLTFS